VRLQGPCVRDLANLVLGSLRLVHEAEKRDTFPRCGRKGSTFVQALGSHGLQGKREVQRSVRLTVRYAVQRCWITTPYFLPPLRLMRAMIRSAARGVDVRLLTAGVSDVPIARAASQHIYGQFLNHGVRIFEMFDATLHAKTMVIDGLYSTVGSFNLDQFSDKRNLEVNVGMIDPDVARVVEQDFERNLSQAREVTLENWKRRTHWQRFVHWCAYQLTRL
jgi:cardiolipin synthase